MLGHHIKLRSIVYKTEPKDAQKTRPLIIANKTLLHQGISILAEIHADCGCEMPIKPEQLKDKLRTEAWIVDVFAHAWAHLSTFLDPTMMTSHEDVWNREREEVTNLRMSEIIVDKDGDIPAEFWKYLDMPSTDAGV